MKNAAWSIVVSLIVAGLVASVRAQTPPINPRGLAFTCPDHDQDDAHEIDIVRASEGTVVQTLLLGDPDSVNGEVVFDVNVMPIAFGDYLFVARAVAGAYKSPNSEPSEVWWRRPGAPGKVIVR